MGIIVVVVGFVDSLVTRVSVYRDGSVVGSLVSIYSVAIWVSSWVLGSVDSELMLFAVTVG